MINLDDELAEVTDALISGQTMNDLEGENHELQAVVRQLYQVIDPRTAPTRAFETRLTSRLNAEWDRAYAPTTLRLMDRPVVRLLGLAASVVLILAALIVLAVPDTSSQLHATAIGSHNLAALLVLLGVAGAGAILYYWRSRH